MAMKVIRIKIRMVLVVTSEMVTIMKIIILLMNAIITEIVNPKIMKIINSDFNSNYDHDDSDFKYYWYSW